MAPPTLLQVLPDVAPPTSGVGWIADGVADGMRARGWRVERVTAGDVLPGARGRTYLAVPLGLAFRAVRAARRLAAEGPCIVECHGFASGFVAPALRRRAPPDVLTMFRCHGFWRATVALAAADDVGLEQSAFRTFKSELTYGNLERLAVRFSDAVVVQTAADARFAELVDGTPPERICCLEPGIAAAPATAPARAAREPGRARVLWVGRRSLVKGSDLVEATARLLAARRVPVTLEVIGQDLAAFGAEAGVEVRPAVSRPEVSQAMQAADAFLWTSRYEGFGLAPAEAMAHGLPVISTGVGAMAELLRDGANGLLVAGTSAAAFADAVARFATLPLVERARMGDEARRSVAHLTWERHAERLERFLMARLGARSQARGA